MPLPRSSRWPLFVGVAASLVASAPTAAALPDAGSSGCQPAWTTVSRPRIGQDGDVLTAIAGTTSSDVWAVGVAVTGDETASTLAQHWKRPTLKHVVSPNAGPTWAALSRPAG